MVVVVLWRCRGGKTSSKSTGTAEARAKQQQKQDKPRFSKPGGWGVACGGVAGMVGWCVVCVYGGVWCGLCIVGVACVIWWEGGLCDMVGVWLV